MQIEQKQNRIYKPQSVYTYAAEECNQVSTELDNLIREGGLTPSAGDLTQVKTAVNNIVDTAANNLQSQIDAITSASDVYDVVGTYAELQAYDTTDVPLNDIIKVLQDNTHNDAATYYRLVEVSGNKVWQYIGQEGPYYTKSEIDADFATKAELPSIATNQQVGLVKPDNSTLTISQDGTLSATGNVAAALPLFTPIWEEHLLNNASYLLANTFGWQSGNVYTAGYQELLSEYNNASSTIEVEGGRFTQPNLTSNTSDNCIVTCSAAFSGYEAYKAMDGNTNNCWFPNTTTGWWQIKLPQPILIKSLTHIAGSYSQQTQDIQGRYYTSSDKTTPIGNAISGTYAQGALVTISGIPTEGILTDTIYFEKTGGNANSGIGELQINAITVDFTYKRTPRGYKIADATQEQAILDLYNSTGNARYFILDTTNTRFKLPRWKHNKYQAKAPVIGTGIALGFTNGEVNFGTMAGGNGLDTYQGDYGKAVGTNYSGTRTTSSKVCGIVTDPTKSGIEATLEEDNMYLYFYVGNFSQSATEQTAGLNSSLFNGKVDLDGNNATFPHIVSTYHSGKSWYRIWSDGWCEQGGEVTPASNNHIDINLLVPFADTNYTPMAIAINDTSYNYADKFVSIRALTTTTITVSLRYISGNQSLPIRWRAEGYKAS